LAAAWAWHWQSSADFFNRTDEFTHLQKAAAQTGCL